MRSIFANCAEVKSTDTKASAIRAQMMTVVNSIELAQWVSEAINRLDLYRQLHRRKGREQVWKGRWGKP